MEIRRYLRESRSARYSVLFALPLLLLYEALAWSLSSTGSGFRNGADVLLKSLFYSFGGGHGLLYFNVLLGGVGIWLVARDWRRHPGPLSRGLFAGMLAESVVLALLVGVVVGRLTATLLQMLAIGGTQATFGEQMMLSLGAGLYEELLFRVILVGALAWLGRRAFGWTPRVSGIVACVLGALLFSAFHYIGPYAYPLELQSFTFRALAGLVFSAIFLLRGFGIAAWTHALYDVFVTLMQG